MIFSWLQITHRDQASVNVKLAHAHLTQLTQNINLTLMTLVLEMRRSFHPFLAWWSTYALQARTNHEVLHTSNTCYSFSFLFCIRAVFSFSLYIRDTEFHNLNRNLAKVILFATQKQPTNKAECVAVWDINRRDCIPCTCLSGIYQEKERLIIPPADSNGERKERFKDFVRIYYETACNQLIESGADLEAKLTVQSQWHRNQRAALNITTGVIPLSATDHR